MPPDPQKTPAPGKSPDTEAPGKNAGDASLSDGWRVAFILGGTRSGKTSHALSLTATRAMQNGATPVYLATAQAHDAEMTARIDNHKAERGPEWQTVEEPLEVPDAVLRHAKPGNVLLLDCLTLWVSNLMGAERDMDAAFMELVAALKDVQGPVVIVSNETGLGIVPDNPLARSFRDRSGLLNQMVAATADKVQFVAAGLPLTLK